MKIPPTLLKMEDYPDFDGERKERLVRTLNSFFNAVSSALNSGLTFADNLSAATKEVVVASLPTARDPLTVDVSLSGNRKPRYVLVTQAWDETDPNANPIPLGGYTPQWTAGASKSGGHTIAIRSLFESGIPGVGTVLVSPDGSRWKPTINNVGAVTWAKETKTPKYRLQLLIIGA